MKRKLMAALLALVMCLSLLPTVAMAETNGSCQGGDDCSHQAAIGTTHYDTLAAAISAVSTSETKTITLLSNIDNAARIELPEKVTLDGNGHTISGNSAVYINAAGGTVQNVVFEGIHNTATLTDNEKAKYNLTRTDGKLTAIYGNALSGPATITGCTFDNVDWDAIQITPVANAVVSITGNTFKHTANESAIRYVHIQSAKNVDFSATVTGNTFLNCDKLVETGIEVYYPTDANKVDCSGNYMDAPMGVCIGTGGTSWNNAYEKAFPFKDAELKNNVTVAITVYEPNENTYFYPTEEEAIKAGVVAKIGTMGYKTLAAAVAKVGNGETIKLLRDIDLNAPVVVSSKTITLDMDSKKIHNTNDIWNDTDWSLIEVRDNGKLTITGNGMLDAKDNDCYAIDLYGGDVVIESGTFVGNISAVYVYSGTAEITGGSFSLKQKMGDGDPDRYLINLFDENGKNGTAKAVITGGSFSGFNPSSSTSENPVANFVAEGYEAINIGNEKAPVFVVAKSNSKPQTENNVKVNGTTVDVTKSAYENIAPEVSTAVSEVEVVSSNVQKAIDRANTAIKNAISTATGDVDVTVATTVNVDKADTDKVAAITSAAGTASTVLKSIEVTVSETVTVKENGTQKATATTNVPQTDYYQLITIPFDPAVGSSNNLIVYRQHGTEIAAMRKAADAARGDLAAYECFWIDGNSVVIKANKFSTYSLVLAAAPVPVYTPYSGSSGSVPSGHTMTTNLSGITAVYVDGKKVDSKNYTISGGNVTLTQAYLNTLSAGKHTFKAENATHIATGTFNVAKGAVSPQTADAGIAIYGMMSIMSLMGMGYIGKKKSR